MKRYMIVSSEDIYNALRNVAINLNYLVQHQKSKIYRYRISTLAYKMSKRRNRRNPVITNQIKCILESLGFNIVKRGKSGKVYYLIVFNKEEDLEKLKKLLSLVKTLS